MIIGLEKIQTDTDKEQASVSSFIMMNCELHNTLIISNNLLLQ